MEDRTCQVWEWLDTGEVFVVLSPAESNPYGRIWNTLVLEETPKSFVMNRVGELSSFSDLWFSSSEYNHRVRRLA